MVRRISGKYKANTILHLIYNNNDITDVKEICNTLAKQFDFNLSSDNYSHMFNRYRLKLEKKTIDFDTNDHYSYNDVFTLHELKQQLKYHVIHHQVLIQFTINYSSIYLKTVCYYFCIFLITFG